MALYQWVSKYLREKYMMKTFTFLKSFTEYFKFQYAIFMEMNNEWLIKKYTHWHSC